MITIHLTADEKTLFEKLPADIQEGWTVEEEKQTFQDTPDRARVRLSLLRIEDPKMLQVIEEAKSKESADDVASLILDTDLSGISERELAKLFFAIGPTTLSTIISAMLVQVKTDQDLKDLVAVTTVRNVVLSSMTHSSKVE